MLYHVRGQSDIRDNIKLLYNRWRLVHLQTPVYSIPVYQVRTLSLGASLNNGDIEQGMGLYPGFYSKYSVVHKLNLDSVGCCCCRWWLMLRKILNEGLVAALNWWERGARFGLREPVAQLYYLVRMLGQANWIVSIPKTYFLRLIGRERVKERRCEGLVVGCLKFFSKVVDFFLVAGLLWVELICVTCLSH